MPSFDTKAAAQLGRASGHTATPQAANPQANPPTNTARRSGRGRLGSLALRGGEADAGVMRAATASDAAPVDLSFLETYTLGNAQLRDEVLESFLAHAPTLLRAATANTPDAWYRAMHGLKGSARGIGARCLGTLAEHAEAQAAHVADDPVKQATHLVQIEAELDRIAAQAVALKQG